MMKFMLLRKKMKETLLSQNSDFSKSALRVLGFAYREYDKMPSEIQQNIIENNMIFVGLVGMIDHQGKKPKRLLSYVRQLELTPI